MNWKRLFALLLVLALLPALFGNAFAAGPKARTLTDADYAPIDALWAELDAVEQDAQTQSAQDGPDRTLAAAQAVAEAVTASDLYVDGTLQWRGAQFSFETTTGVTCAYSPRLRELARKAAGSIVETEAVEPQTSTTTSADITLIEPYYGLDPSFTQQYQNEVKKLAAATGGSSQVLKTTRATIDAVAAAVESSGLVIFDSHGSTDYENPWNEEDLVSGATTSYLLLQTGTGLTTEDYAKDGNTYHAQYMGSYGTIKYYAVDGTCIANHMTKSAPDSLIWSAICLGMATDGLCAPLRAEGVSVFYGYSQSVTFDYDYKWEEVFFARLRAGDTVAQAVAQMKTEIGQWDYCSEYLTIESARRNYCAFPIVSSALDTYPGKGKVDALQEVHSDWQLFGKAQFTVTAVSANTALGTVVPLNDLTFEAKPAENAAVSGWSLQPEGAAAVTQDGNVFTVSDVRKDCTLVVEFRQRVPATVVFSTPEGASQPMQRSYVGEEMALTAPEGKPLANAHDYVFAGWTDTPVADAVQVSTVYTDTYTPIRAMVTLYALYSWQDGETTRYTTQPQNKVCPSEAFSDLDVTQWYHEPVDYMLETGMMNGMSATTFEPNGTLTRAQLVTVLYRHAGSPDVTGLANPFADVAPQAWYENAVIWAAANGVVKGTSAATFAPEDAITREQIAAILYRYNGEAVTGDLLSSFPDAGAVSGYAVEAMQWAVSRGLISGDPASDGTLWLRPRDGATRAQIAKILWVWLGA